MILRLLMLPITIMILVRQYYAERQAALESEYFCECPKDCVLHETIKQEQAELFTQAITAITMINKPKEQKAPGDYLLEMRLLDCDVCEGTQRLDLYEHTWCKDWDEGTPYGWCPECFPGATFQWMGTPLPDLETKRLYNIIMAIERGTWATSGKEVKIRKRFELALRYEYAMRNVTDGDIIKIEMANMKWHAEQRKKRLEREEAEVNGC